jgi:hypothetical protein
MANNIGSLEPSRQSLHRLAEHVLSPALYAATREIGLLPAPGGLCTPKFGDPGRVIEVDGSELVLRQNGGERRAAVQTLRHAAAFAHIVPGMPAQVYAPATSCELDEPLELDPGVIRMLARWYALGAQGLDGLITQLAGPEGVTATLWPEHLDYAATTGTVNFGASPGDASIVEPYAYAGPQAGPPDDGDAFWNAPFGAARTIRTVDTAPAVLAFFLAGYARLATPWVLQSGCLRWRTRCLMRCDGGGWHGHLGSRRPSVKKRQMASVSGSSVSGRAAPNETFLRRSFLIQPSTSG